MITAEDSQIFYDAIAQAKHVFITAHVGPDGDTLGSMLGLKHTFEAYFPNIKTIDCVIAGRMPDIYHFMPGIDYIKDVESATDLLNCYDVAFSVDCGAADRLGPAKTYFVGAKQSINIDHHYSNSRFGTVNIIDEKASASGEVVVDLLAANNIAITRDAATCLYVAILTDTGGFKYANTTAKIFELAAELTRQGANPEQIYRAIYETPPKRQVMLQSQALLNAHFNADETLSWAMIDQAFMKQFDAQDEHIEGLVECLRRIDTVLVSAIFRETRMGHTKVSFRSDVNWINVADIAAHWNGGGHKMAAGCTIQYPPDVAAEQVVPVLEQAIRQGKTSFVPSTP